MEVYVIQTDTQTKKPKLFNSTFFIALSCIMAWDSGVVIDHTLWGRSLTSHFTFVEFLNRRKIERACYPTLDAED